MARGRGYSAKEVLQVGRHRVNRARYDDFRTSALVGAVNSHHIKQHTKPVLTTKIRSLLEDRQKKLPTPYKAMEIVKSMHTPEFMKALGVLAQFGPNMVQLTNAPLLMFSPQLSDQQQAIVHKLCNQPILMLYPGRTLSPSVQLDLRVTEKVPWPHEGSYATRVSPWLHNPPAAWMAVQSKLMQFWFAKYLLNIQSATLWNYFDLCLKVAGTWGQLLHLCPAARVMFEHAFPDMKTPKRINVTQFEGALADEYSWEAKEALIQMRDKHTKTFEKALSEGVMLQSVSYDDSAVHFGMGIHQAFEFASLNCTNYIVR